MNMYNPHELYHHGILGQKWGVRRFQNEDGTLTPAGRKRKAKLEAQYEKVTGKKVVSEDPQSMSGMSDDELRARIARVKAENDLMDLEIAWNRKYSELHPPKVNKAKEFIKERGGKVLDAALDVGIDLGKKWATNTLANKLGLESEWDKLKRITDTMKYKRDIASYQKDIKEFTKGESDFDRAKREAEYSDYVKQKLQNDETIERLRNKRSGRA